MEERLARAPGAIRGMFAAIAPLGSFLSADGGAYAYLPASVANFPDRNDLAARVARVGFEVLLQEELSAGIAALTVARWKEAS
ncbi:MAG: class I SAM-dependent methyltransferase [Acidobacteriota bacterium]